jgi:hypothetical protein
LKSSSVILSSLLLKCRFTISFAVFPFDVGLMLLTFVCFVSPGESDLFTDLDIIAVYHSVENYMPDFKRNFDGILFANLFYGFISFIKINN